MRYPIKIVRPLRGFFWLFGWSAARSYAELDEYSLSLHFGRAHVQVPLVDIAGVEHRHWPWFFGLGAKLVPGGGVAYVGSSSGVVQINFTHPRPMRVWGPISVSRARYAIVSLENVEQFIQDLRIAIARN